MDDTVNEDKDIANDNHRIDFDDEDSNMSDDLLQPTQVWFCDVYNTMYMIVDQEYWMLLFVFIFLSE